MNKTNPYRKFLSLLALIIGLHLIPYEWAHANDALVLNEKPVVLYGTSWCSHCKNARAYLRSLNVEFTDYDIETSDIAKQKYLALKGKGVPLIFVGKVRIDGFNQQALEKALRDNGLIPAS